MNKRKLTMIMPSYSVRAGAVFFAVLATVAVMLIPAEAQAARKEFWHDLRHDFISVNYVYGVQSNNPGIRLLVAGEESADPSYRLTYDDAQSGWNLKLAIDFNNWFGMQLASLSTERNLTLRDLVYTTTMVEGRPVRNVSNGDERYTGSLTLTTYDYAVVFHTPGAIFSFDAAVAYSRVNAVFELIGTNLELSNLNPGRMRDGDRHGWKFWTGIRFRMGDRWELDGRFYQSLYNDLYDEVSMFEGSLAFAPAPKTEIRLSAFYDINTSVIRGDLGLRFYF